MSQLSSLRLDIHKIVEKLINTGNSILYQNTALFPILQVQARIREKSRDQLGDFEGYILRLVQAGVTGINELSFLTGFPERKLDPLVAEMAGRGLLREMEVGGGSYSLSELGVLTIQHGSEVLETDRVLLLCGLSGHLLPRNLYSLTAIEPEYLKNAGYVPDLIQESYEVPLQHLDIRHISNKRAVNLPDETIEITGVIANSAAPKFLDCAVILYKSVEGKLKVELHFLGGVVDWLDWEAVFGMVEPLGFPNSAPEKVMADIAVELEKLGFGLEGNGRLDVFGNPVFTIKHIDETLLREKKYKGRSYCLYVGAVSQPPLPLSIFPGLLRGRTITLNASSGSKLEMLIKNVRVLNSLVREFKQTAQRGDIKGYIEDRLGGIHLTMAELKEAATFSGEKRLMESVAD